jgi:hypothetical protein
MRLRREDRKLLCSAREQTFVKPRMPEASLLLTRDDHFRNEERSHAKHGHKGETMNRRVHISLRDAGS